MVAGLAGESIAAPPLLVSWSGVETGVVTAPLVLDAEVGPALDVGSLDPDVSLAGAWLVGPLGAVVVVVVAAVVVVVVVDAEVVLVGTVLVGLAAAGSVVVPSVAAPAAAPDPVPATVPALSGTPLACP
jgi:hypothetical protein